jgi:hypothetical protein
VTNATSGHVTEVTSGHVTSGHAALFMEFAESSLNQYNNALISYFL